MGAGPDLSKQRPRFHAPLVVDLFEKAFMRRKKLSWMHCPGAPPAHTSLPKTHWGIMTYIWSYLKPTKV